MTRLIAKGIGVAALAVALMLSTAARSEAAFFAYICNDAACAGGDDIFVQDENVTSGGGGVDQDSGIVGMIRLRALNYNGFAVSVNQSQSQPLLAQGMDLNYSVTTSGAPGTGTIYLYATDTGFAYPSVSGVLGGTSDNGSVTASICVNGANVNSPLTGNFGACSSATDNTPIPISIALSRAGGAGPYSLTLGVAVSLTGTGTTATGDFRVVPEPAIMALLGLGLTGVAARRRRRS